VRAMHEITLKSAWALAAVIVCLPAPALAQELRRDSVWNGVVTGAAIGGGLGVGVAKTTDSILFGAGLRIAPGRGWRSAGASRGRRDWEAGARRARPMD